MNKHIYTGIRLTTGILFIASALLKLFSIDSFEVYIYSFNLLSLSYAFLFARIVIGFELLLGILFLLNIFTKQVAIVTIGMLLSFICFLFYLIFTKNPESCHCFGSYIEISHTNSIIKNILIISLVLVILKYNKPLSFRFNKIVATLCSLISMSIPFLVSPPDTFNLSVYVNKTTYNKEALQKYLDTKTPSKGRHVLCFFGTGCRFCKLTSKKITVIAEKAAEKGSSFSIVFWGDEKTIAKFFTETNCRKFPYEIMDGNQFLRITDGQMPVILLLENGVVKKKYGYRDLNEDEILYFLKDQK